MSNITIVDAAITLLDELNQELEPRLQPHPVPQSDARAKGLIISFTKNTAEQALAGLPVLYTAVLPQLNNNVDYILAANQTPPTHYADFAMRPHVDRRWLGNGFSKEAALWTTVMFLKFPSAAKGGELVLFENADEQQVNYLNTMERKDGRTKLNALACKLVLPEPGRICKFPGNLPHAVLGYTEGNDKTQRLSIVLAEFSK